MSSPVVIVPCWLNTCENVALFVIWEMTEINHSKDTTFRQLTRLHLIRMLPHSVTTRYHTNHYGTPVCQQMNGDNLFTLPLEWIQPASNLLTRTLTQCKFIYSNRWVSQQCIGGQLVVINVITTKPQYDSRLQYKECRWTRHAQESITSTTMTGAS